MKRKRLYAAMAVLLFTSMESRSEAVREDFPYASKFVDVLGARMHYADSEGSGDPILFVHGIPTWSYLWRDVMPGLEDRGRLIAVDLIGFGKSDKPNKGNTLSVQVSYFESFVEAMGLDRITLVLHDMGSYVGLHYAMENPERIKGIVFMESMLTLDTWEGMAPESAEYMRAMRNYDFAYNATVVENQSIAMVIPYSTKRTLSPDEMAAYQEPFSTKEERESLVSLWMDFPISGEPKESHQIQASYIQRLKRSRLPKLMLTISEPLVGTKAQVEWVKEVVPETTIRSVGEGRHFMQEDQPEGISQAISEWMVENGL